MVRELRKMADENEKQKKKKMKELKKELKKDGKMLKKFGYDLEEKNEEDKSANPDCIFCKIVKGEIESEKVYEDDNFIGFFDIRPVSEGHTLIIPKKHYETILDMPNTVGNELVEALKKVALDLINKGKAEGFNIVQSNYRVAQQEVPHLHFHIIPRRKGDGLVYRWK